jgi:hypothetical protein
MIVFVQALSRRRADQCQPSHLAVAVRVCGSGPSVDWKRIADAHRNGSDGVGCDTGGCCRRIGRAAEPIGTRRRQPASRAVGTRTAVPALAKRLSEPFVVFAVRPSETAEDGTAAQGATVVSSIARGVAPGFVSAPCAGLVRRLNLTGAPLLGASDEPLLLTFAAGARTSLAGALLVGSRGPHRQPAGATPGAVYVLDPGYRLTHSLSAKGAHQ